MTIIPRSTVNFESINERKVSLGVDLLKNNFGTGFRRRPSPSQETSPKTTTTGNF